jgi:hypothetical protein
MHTTNPQVGSILVTVRLLAPASSRGAWYELWLTTGKGGYLVTKTSGDRSGPRDTRSWPHPELAAAERRFTAILRSKTNPVRQGRRYQPDG